MPTDDSLIFITDRTNADVQTAIANKNSPIPQRGALNYQDLNRIENNMFIIINLLKPLGEHFYFDLKYNWVETDRLKFVDANRIRNNVYVMNNSFYNSSIQPISQRNRLNFQEVNLWETYISECNQSINKIENSYRYCGELICGEW